jgi:glycosyltransferase involved in cell wall biosynthesis
VHAPGRTTARVHASSLPLYMLSAADLVGHARSSAGTGSPGAVPAVSVIIPAFNASRTLRRALDSVFAQTYADYETIVVDDGSTDDLDEALLPYQGRVRLVRQANAGPATARNTGAAHARGKLLAFLDADDFWHRRKLEIQVAAFAQIPDLAFCWTDRLWLNPRQVSEADVDSVPVNGVQTAQVDFDSVFAAPYLGTPGVMMTKALFDELKGFRTDLESAEDVDLWLRAAYGQNIAYIPYPLFFIVRSPGSVTARRMDGTYADNLRVIDDFCRENPGYAASSSRTVARARAKVWENWGSGLLGKQQLQAARRCLRKSLANRITPRAAYLWMKAALLEVV